MKLYILGGRPCSGKTTFAYQLGLKKNIEVMYLDVFAHEITQEATEDSPELYKWKTKEMIEILQENPRKLFLDYLAYYDELFPLFLEELRKSNKTAIILESAMLLPKYVKLLEVEFDVSVVYLKTTDEFVKSVYPQRDYAIELLKTIKGRTSLENLLERDALFAKSLYKCAHDFNYRVITIPDKDCFEKEFYNVLEYFST